MCGCFFIEHGEECSVAFRAAQLIVGVPAGRQLKFIASRLRNMRQQLAPLLRHYSVLISITDHRARPVTFAASVCSDLLCVRERLRE